MCINKETSITAFIVGIIITISMMIYLKKPIYIAIGIIWIWVLGMQLSEFFIWSNQDSCNNSNKIATNAALILNLTQPIIVFLILSNLDNIKPMSKYVATGVVLFYICYVMYLQNNVTNTTCVKSSESCMGLNLEWWEKFNNGGFIYLICLLLIIIFLTKDNNLEIGIFTSIFICIALAISIKWYACNQPSMWCLMVCIYPIFLTLFVKLKQIE